MSLTARIEDVVAKLDMGKPSAAKRGRNPQYPYVPIVDFGEQEIGRNTTRTEQLKGWAFPTHELAVDHAEKVIAARRTALAARLKEPRLRALRQHYGLPAEMEAA